MMLVLLLPAAEQSKALRRALKQGSVKVRRGRAALTLLRFSTQVMADPSASGLFIAIHSTEKTDTQSDR